MKQFKDALKSLESSKEFKDWKKKNPDAYLTHGFFVLEEADDNWRIGFYHKKDDKITSFIVGNKVTIEPEEEIFKKDKKVVQPLDSEKTSQGGLTRPMRSIEFSRS